MRILLFSLFCIASIFSLQADSTQRPKPIDMSKRTPVHRVVEINNEQTISLFSNKALPRFDTANLPNILQHPGYKGRIFVDLAKLSQPLKGKGFQLGENEWIAFDLAQSKLHMFVDERLAALFHARFSAEIEQPVQIKLQGRLLSVKRQKDPFAQWTMDNIQSASPIELLQFSLLTRSGEKCYLTSPTKENEYAYEIETEPTLSEDYSIVDIRIALSLSPLTTDSGLQLNTGITLQTNHDFIQPIGISTDPERLTVLVLRPEVINPKGKIVSPIE